MIQTMYRYVKDLVSRVLMGFALFYTDRITLHTMVCMRFLSMRSFVHIQYFQFETINKLIKLMRISQYFFRLILIFSNWFFFLCYDKCCFAFDWSELLAFTNDDCAVDLTCGKNNNWKFNFFFFLIFVIIEDIDQICNLQLLD